jgi:hypothetical protein
VKHSMLFMFRLDQILAAMLRKKPRASIDHSPDSPRGVAIDSGVV